MTVSSRGPAETAHYLPSLALAYLGTAQNLPKASRNTTQDDLGPMVARSEQTGCMHPGWGLSYAVLRYSHKTTYSLSSPL